MRPIDADKLIDLWKGIDPAATVHPDSVIGSIEREKPLDMQPVVHAHWEVKYNPEELSGYTLGKCSNCGEVEPICFISDWDFCPHCGAKMDEERNNG